jgi:hypothetical protein
MASSGKRKTTMAKLNRERRLLERRVEKQARKDARKRAAADEAAGGGVTDAEPPPTETRPLPAAAGQVPPQSS